MKRQKPYYPLRTKKKAVQLVAAGLISELEACQKFKISIKLLHEWQRCGSPPGHDKFFVQPHVNTDFVSKKKLSAKEKINKLEQQLKHERLKSEAYETMISIAEEEFDIKIEKKRGAGHPVPDSPKNEAKVSFYRLEGALRIVWCSRQAYYHAIKQKKKEDEKAKLMVNKVKKIREDLPGTGTRRLHYLTISYRKKNGIKMGRDKLHEVLREADMHISFRKRRTRTTYSEHGYKRYKNLTERLEVTSINQLYVSDITYIPIGRKYANLSLVTDAFSRKIIGWHLHKSMHAEGTIQALKMALDQKDKQPGKEPLPYQLIHPGGEPHSDRGVQRSTSDTVVMNISSSLRTIKS